MYSFIVQIARKGVFKLGILETDVGEQHFLPEDVVDVSAVPNIFEGDVFCDGVDAVLNGKQVQNDFLVLVWRELLEMGAEKLQERGELLVVSVEDEL